MRRRLLRVLLWVLGIFALMQLVPYRVTNPPDRHEPPWDSARTRQLAVTACYACHSDQTHVYGFERIAPLSWWVTNHVERGRHKLNFSQWDIKAGPMGDAVKAVKDGSMPPDYYTWFGLHADAKLSAAERAELLKGMQATFLRNIQASPSGQ